MRPRATPHRRCRLSRGFCAPRTRWPALLADGTELFVGRIAFAADGPAFTLMVDSGDPPDAAALAGENTPKCLRTRLRVCLPARPRPSLRVAH